MNGKPTSYTNLRNIFIQLQFNQSINQSSDIQPVTIRAHAEAVTVEGASINVDNTVPVGDPVQTPLTNDQIYQAVFALSDVLANALSGVLQNGIAMDTTAIDVSQVTPVTMASIQASNLAKGGTINEQPAANDTSKSV